MVTSVFAFSFTASLTPSATTVAPGKELIVTLKVSNIDAGDKGDAQEGGAAAVSTLDKLAPARAFYKDQGESPGNHNAQERRKEAE